MNIRQSIRRTYARALLALLRPALDIELDSRATREGKLKGERTLSALANLRPDDSWVSADTRRERRRLWQKIGAAIRSAETPLTPAEQQQWHLETQIPPRPVEKAADHS